MVPLSCPPTRSPPLSRRGAVSLREHLSANGYTQVGLGKVQKCVQKRPTTTKVQLANIRARLLFTGLSTCQDSVCYIQLFNHRSLHISKL